MSAARQLLRDLNLPDGDRYDLPTSSRRFPDGGHYRIEIPSVEGPAAMAAVIVYGTLMTRRRPELVEGIGRRRAGRDMEDGAIEHRSGE